MDARAALVSAAAVGALLTGCGSGTATTGTGSTSQANPHLAGTTPTMSISGSAAEVARGIAARWASTGVPRSARSTPIEFRSIDDTATIFNPGTPSGFTAFITTRRTTVVTPSSAATVKAVNQVRPRFATSTDQALWKADGSPSLGQAPANGQVQTIPAGQFSFLPQGSTLTYQRAAGLSGDADHLSAAIMEHLRPYAGAHPPPSLQLRQLAYLIATAPLNNAARSAAWQALASLPGLHTCRAGLDWSQPHVAKMCADSPSDETQISLDTTTGAILAVADRLLQRTPMYPHVPTGTVIESSTFVTG